MTPKEARAASKVAARFTGQVWITQDNMRYYPDQMKTSHILNTLAMIQDGRMAKAGRTSCSGLNLDQWSKVFGDELKLRSK